MPMICAVPGCKGNYKTGPKVSVFNFPKDELKLEWLRVISREEFEPTRNSRVCELHFEPSQIVREASAVDCKTGLTLTAPLYIPRLKKGAVPTLLMPTPETLTKTRMVPKKLVKIQPKEEAVTEETEIIDECQLAKLSQSDLGTEIQNVAETPFVIKQEPAQSVDKLQRLVIGNGLRAEELTSCYILSPPSSSLSPSISSSPICSSPYSSSTAISSPSFIITLPFLENESVIANPDSTNVDETPATQVLNKPAQKRKISDVESDNDGATPDAAQPKSSILSKLHPPAGTSKKSAGPSNIPTNNVENTTREMFESLADGSENNPLFGSRTRERSGDLFDVFADFIAEKLREMDWDDCAYSLKAILDVVYKTGKVQRKSEVGSDISSPGASPRPSDKE